MDLIEKLDLLVAKGIKEKEALKMLGFKSKKELKNYQKEDLGAYTTSESVVYITMKQGKPYSEVVTDEEKSRIRYWLSKEYIKKDPRNVQYRGELHYHKELLGEVAEFMSMDEKERFKVFQKSKQEALIDANA